MADDKIDSKPGKDEVEKTQPSKDEVRVNVEVEREIPEPKEPSGK